MNNTHDFLKVCEHEPTEEILRYNFLWRMQIKPILQSALGRTAKTSIVCRNGLVTGKKVSVTQKKICICEH